MLLCTLQYIQCQGASIKIEEVAYQIQYSAETAQKTRFREKIAYDWKIWWKFVVDEKTFVLESENGFETKDRRPRAYDQRNFDWHQPIKNDQNLSKSIEIDRNWSKSTKYRSRVCNFE